MATVNTINITELASSKMQNHCKANPLTQNHGILLGQRTSSSGESGGNAVVKHITVCDVLPVCHSSLTSLIIEGSLLMAVDMFPNMEKLEGGNEEAAKKQTVIVGFYTANELLGNDTPCTAIQKTMDKLVGNQKDESFAIVVIKNRAFNNENDCHPFNCISVNREGKFNKVLDGDKVQCLNTVVGGDKIYDFEDMLEAEESGIVGMSWRN